MKFQSKLVVFLITCVCSDARINSSKHGNEEKGISQDNHSRKLDSLEAHVLCGNGLRGNGSSSCKNEVPKSVNANDDNEKYAVRCCYDSDPKDHFLKKKSGCDVWARSSILHECHEKKTFTEAVGLCNSDGGRLCTSNEIASECARGSGCNFDSFLIWTSPTPTQLSQCDGDCISLRDGGVTKHVGCGNGFSSCKDNVPKYVIANNSDEKYSVRCCYDNDQNHPSPYKKNAGCNVWADSSDECHAAKTFTEAVDVCGDIGGRLCTKEEVDNKCTKGTGCDFDGDLIWTSTTPTLLLQCEGDCNSDNDCEEDLKCFQRNDFTAVPGCQGAGVEIRDYCTSASLVPVGLDATGNLNSNFVETAQIAAKLSQGIYYSAQDFDADLAGLGPYHNITVLKDTEISNSINAAVLWKDRTCYAGFRGMVSTSTEFDQDQSSNDFLGIDVPNLGTVALAILVDKQNFEEVVVPNIKQSGAFYLERFFPLDGEPPSGDCPFNKYLLKNWIKNHYEPHFEGKDDLLSDIEQCMTDCKHEYNEGECNVVYTGHSMGGVSAMATAYWFADKDFNKVSNGFREPTILTFGQPGTFIFDAFDQGECVELNRFEENTYRFINVYKDDDNDVKLDPTVSIGGAHMGNTIFLSNDSMRVKLYDKDAGLNYGPEISNVENWMIDAHQMGTYEDRIDDFDMGSNSAIEARGFRSNKMCTKDSDCYDQYCTNGTC